MRRTSFRPRLLPALSVLLVPLCAAATGNSAAVAVAAPTPTMCGNEPMPAIEPMYTLVCAMDKGVSPDTGADQGDAIRAALTSLISSEAGLYFPQGQYIVRGSLPLRTGNVLVGSRSGVTHFINDQPATTAITHTLHSAMKILVEGLVLDNISIQFLHAGTSVARYNGLRGTRSANPQISTIGADQILGNVLWREAAFPGVGISAPLGTGALIEGNLLGVDDPRATATGPIGGLRQDVRTRTRSLIKQMSLLPAPIGAGIVASQDRGHFTEALDVGRTTGTRILTNDIAVNSVSASGGDPRWAARVRGSQGFTLGANRFATVGPDGTADAVLELVAPQNGRVAMNRLDRVPLLLSPDARHQRPTKQTVVNKNEWVNAVIRVTQPVTGDDPASTTINDLRFVYNHFVTADPTQCLIDAPIPSQPGRTFGETGNTRGPGNEPAKTCNLRPWVPRVDNVVPPLPTDASLTPPPPVTGEEVSPDLSNRTGVEGSESVSRCEPPVTSPATPPSTQSEEPRKPWHKRLGERLKKAWKKVF